MQATSYSKVLFVNDTSDSPNWGSRATSFALYDMLKEAGASVSSLSQSSLLQADWRTTPRREKFAVSSGLLEPPKNLLGKASKALMNRLVQTLPDVVPAYWKDFPSYAESVKAGRALSNLKEQLEHCDYVLINGEGGVFGRGRQSRFLFFIAYLAKQVFEKPVAFVSHTADLSDPVLYAMARGVYPLLDEIVFREARSAEQAKDFLKSYKVAADAAFRYQPAPKLAWQTVAGRKGYFHHFPVRHGAVDVTKPYLCIGGSSAYKGVTAELGRTFGKLCQRFVEEGHQVVLTASAKTDEALFTPIARELRLPLIPLATSVQQAVDILGNASLYIGGRYHGAIFAFTGGTPVVPLSAETFKMHALIEQMGLESPVFDAHKLEQNQAEICQKANAYLLAGEAHRKIILKRVALLRETLEQHVLGIKPKRYEKLSLLQSPRRAPTAQKPPLSIPKI